MNREGRSLVTCGVLLFVFSLFLCANALDLTTAWTDYQGCGTVQIPAGSSVNAPANACLGTLVTGIDSVGTYSLFGSELGWNAPTASLKDLSLAQANDNNGHLDYPTVATVDVAVTILSASEYQYDAVLDQTLDRTHVYAFLICGVVRPKLTTSEYTLQNGIIFTPGPSSGMYNIYDQTSTFQFRLTRPCTEQLTNQEEWKVVSYFNSLAFTTSGYECTEMQNLPDVAEVVETKSTSDNRNCFGIPFSGVGKLLEFAMYGSYVQGYPTVLPAFIKEVTSNSGGNGADYTTVARLNATLGEKIMDATYKYVVQFSENTEIVSGRNVIIMICGLRDILKASKPIGVSTSFALSSAQPIIRYQSVSSDYGYTYSLKRACSSVAEGDWNAACGVAQFNNLWGWSPEQGWVKKANCVQDRCASSDYTPNEVSCPRPAVPGLSYCECVRTRGLCSRGARAAVSILNSFLRTDGENSTAVNVTGRIDVNMLLSSFSGVSLATKSFNITSATPRSVQRTTENDTIVWDPASDFPENVAFQSVVDDPDVGLVEGEYPCGTIDSISRSSYYSGDLNDLVTDTSIEGTFSSPCLLEAQKNALQNSAKRMLGSPANITKMLYRYFIKGVGVFPENRKRASPPPGALPFYYWVSAAFNVSGPATSLIAGTDNYLGTSILGGYFLTTEITLDGTDYVPDDLPFYTPSSKADRISDAFWLVALRGIYNFL